jgi:hypothetical protein
MTIHITILKKFRYGNLSNPKKATVTSGIPAVESGIPTPMLKHLHDQTLNVKLDPLRTVN